MLKSPVRLHLPKNCLQCEGTGTIALQTIVHGHAIQLAWVCQSCGRETPIHVGAAGLSDRRTGTADRRRVTRQDRRHR